MSHLTDLRNSEPRETSRRGRVRRNALALFCLSALLLTLAAAGCRSGNELETTYGQRRGSAARSVNGTSVLAGMFAEAGMRVVSVKSLSSRLEKYDVLVWAPNDFAPPRKDVLAFVEKWLENESDVTDQSQRILVYIGRDYEASCDYWRAVLPMAPPDQRIEVMRRRAEARSRHDNARVDMPHEECNEWFVMRRDFSGRRVDRLEGHWSDVVDVPQTEIWSQGRLAIPTPQDLSKLWKNEPPPDHLQPKYQPLLQSGDETLVYEVSKPAWRKSKIFVVANGSFLLNLPLVNRQHRALAGRLIERCRVAESVAFLESGAGGPPVTAGPERKTSDQAVRSRVLLAMHYVVWGILFCFCVFPIFGRPRSLEGESVADFGQHIDALAALLERTGDKHYARQQLELYHKIAPGEKKKTRPHIGESPFAEVQADNTQANELKS